MLATRFTKIVGCTVPLQEAGMGQLATPRLAAAIADAGGLGMVGVSGAPAEYVAKALEEVRRLTSGVFGANFIVPSMVDGVTGKLDPGMAAALEEAASRARVVEFFYADPDPSLVDRAHAGGALACWQVGYRDEAIAAERAGCDLIVAQGREAGGHVRGKIGLHALLGEVLPAVHVPVVAAGGIGTGRGMAGALAAGASAVRVGTRFVAAAESEAHPRYIEKLIAAEAKDTVLTEAFSANWPNAPHRVLRSCIEAMEGEMTESVGERVYAWAPDERVPVRRADSMVPMRTTTGNIDAMPHWAGESVTAVKLIQPAGEIVRELAEEAERLLRQWGS
ncbi:MAG TPA: nitronate monooxygenase [Thermoplasmata archaeon]|nr:nitronate monooxygenase [Thermoplasmata archaeon]